MMEEKPTILNPGEGLSDTLAMKLAREYFGGYVRQLMSFGTTGAAAVPIAPNNPDRIGLQIVNNSDAVIYVGFNADVSVIQGIPLSAAGGALILKFRDDGQVCGNQVFGMSAVAGEEFTLVETILWGK